MIVESLDVSGGDIEVTIKNDGDTAITDEFWVDVYSGMRATHTSA